MKLDLYRRFPKEYLRASAKLRTLSPAAYRSAGRTTSNPFVAIALLGIEASRVITLRVMKIAKGGREARNEAFLMIDEKVLAALEACASLFAGHGPEAVINRYRELVAANAKRLAASSAKVSTRAISRWASRLRRKILA
jgi:hypothetical protein